MISKRLFLLALVLLFGVLAQAQPGQDDEDTAAPTEAAIETEEPTAAPSTEAPTIAPTTEAPTVAPTTEVPSESPSNPGDTASPTMTAMPSEPVPDTPAPAAPTGEASAPPTREPTMSAAGVVKTSVAMLMVSAAVHFVL